VWSRDGRALFYLRGTTPANLELVTQAVGPDGVLPTAHVLFNLGSIRALSAVPVPGFDVAPDGRFVFSVFPDTPPTPLPSEIQLIENWFAELNAKVPRTGTRR
jgi:hypothetical protein